MTSAMPADLAARQVLLRRASREDRDHAVGVDGAQPLDERRPVVVGQVEVDRCDFNPHLDDQLPRLGERAGLACDGDVWLAPEQVGERQAKRGVVVHEENADHPLPVPLTSPAHRVPAGSGSGTTLAWIIHGRPGRAASRAQRGWPG